MSKTSGPVDIAKPQAALTLRYPLSTIHYPLRTNASYLCRQCLVRTGDGRRERDRWPAIRIASGSPALKSRGGSCPGQFVMLRWPAATILCWAGRWPVRRGAGRRRPAVFHRHRLSGGRQDDAAAGRVSGRRELEAWGPLGNGFPPTPSRASAEHGGAGGIGQTPFLALAREYLGLHAYGDPPRQVPRAKGSRSATASAAANIWPASTISAGRRRGAAEHR